MFFQKGVFSLASPRVGLRDIVSCSGLRRCASAVAAAAPLWECSGWPVRLVAGARPSAAWVRGCRYGCRSSVPVASFGWLLVPWDRLCHTRLPLCGRRSSSRSIGQLSPFAGAMRSAVRYAAAVAVADSPWARCWLPVPPFAGAVRIGFTVRGGRWASWL